MDEDEIYLLMDEHAQKAVDHTIHEFSSVNTGKASPSMVEGITVDAYGSKMAMRDIAAISTPDPRTIAISPWDKSMIQPIEKAIQTANLGINPAVMGDIVRLPLPELTGERRQELAKLAHKFAEEGRVGVRNARREAMDALKKLKGDGELSEDDLKRGEKEIQSKTDDAIKKISDLLAEKEKDLTTV